MQEEIERRSKEASRPCTAKAREAKAVAETRLVACPGSRKRRPAPLRVVEVCTWTCMISTVAASLAWEVLEPITLPKYDLLTRKGREAARKALIAADPDFIAMAPPCTEWSQMQSVNQRTPMQVRSLRRRRKLQLGLLAFFDEVAQWQHERGVHGNRTTWMLENPLRSKLWVQAPMQATASMMSVGVAVTDACVWEKRRLDTGELVKKPTKVIGTPEVVSAVDVRCAGGHDHCVVEGAMHCPTCFGLGWWLHRRV